MLRKKRDDYMLPILLLLPFLLFGQQTPPFLEELEEPDPSRFYDELFNMLFMLGLLVGGMIVVAWVFRKAMNTHAKQLNRISAIKITDSRSLSNRVQIHVVDIGGKEIVLADSAHGICQLHPQEKTPDAPFEDE